MGETVTRAILGVSTGGLSEAGYLAKDVLSGPKVNTPQQQRLVEQKAEAKALQSAKSRKDRLAAARGRSSMRIKLADDDPRQTRSGLSIG